ncbi:prenyltransferase/squalene oxidase repeat-containing protein [Saccharothrix deserti]|uniref:prenyltransferase/squalene oxidase repeat-containing protein n=1 Tax=Saccharothrix deserti TaxID=2593674 RepID=UPI00131A7C76|nr:prenyltransferase/squalene oxidase repeat-containing protein [Saccharothrix deserti]
MPPVVATGLISVPVPGAWRRLTLIANTNSLAELAEEQVVGRLEELGIPRHHYGLARAVQSWKRALVPPDVALALWLLRECLPAADAWSRRFGMRAEDTGAAIRYIQLSLAAGESSDTDPILLDAAKWLVSTQLADGSIPANLGFGFGEAGTTARVLRLLNRLDEPSLDPALQGMYRYLTEHALRLPNGVGWAYSKVERTVVTGATSHVVLALLENHSSDPLIVEAVRFLLAVQDPSGGWSEVPGFPPTIHNTFNVVRVIKAAKRSGLVEAAVADDALAAAVKWFSGRMRNQHRIRDIAETAFALRLAAELDLLHVKKVELAALRLLQRRRHWLNQSADLYAETEIVALALLECSRALDGSDQLCASWTWRWALPALPPPFLSNGNYLHDLLYSVMRTRWWVRAVDRFVSTSLVERFLGLLLGTIAALGIVDDYVTSVFVGLQKDARGIVTISVITLLLLTWITVKVSWSSSVLRALRNSVGPLGVAGLLTWIFYAPAPFFPPLLAFIGLRWLIIDIVAFTTNSSGLFDRMLSR